jgi:hypothetical protein
MVSSESPALTTRLPLHEHADGRSLFIVDNSVEGWTGLRYLREWTGIAKSFDIATGYFDIGSLLALDGHWQGLEKIRVLMGAQVMAPTRKAMLAGVTARAANVLDASIEVEKDPNPFLHGVPAIVDALKAGQIECRVYDRDKFHAKAFITHAKLEVVGSQALVGSSNFTRPGLTDNVELNIQVQSSREVEQLQEWFELYWEQAREVTPAVIHTIERHTQEFTPFEIYAKSLQEFFRGHELTATEWDETRSRMFPHLDRYQKEGYGALLNIAHQHGGAFLCDGVGLGKTFVGLMLIERLVLHEGKRVVLFAPKAAREAVWDPHLREWLGHIGTSDFTNLAVFNHTDLTRHGDFPDRFRRIAELADAVIIDEAHHFRNPGVRGEDGASAPSRYWRMFDLLDGTGRPKSLYLLTATPINNRLSDFRHMAELFTRRDQSYFARTLGVNNLQAYFNRLEKDLSQRLGTDAPDVSEHIAEAQEVLTTDAVLRSLVVQRSRAYARASQIQETGEAAAFPEREAPRVASYSIRKTYGRLLDMFEQAFQKDAPLFTLAIYYPLHWYRGPDASIDPFEMGRQQQVVGLIRTQFLKRFESSVVAFELSCDRLMKKLLAFVDVHSETEPERKRLERWKLRYAEVLGYAQQRELEFWGAVDNPETDDDVVSEEMRAAAQRLDRSQYDVVEMLQETYDDLDQLTTFLDEARKFDPTRDDKLQRLIALLRTKDLASQKVLIFTEFADTARYLDRWLNEAGITGVAQVDSGTKGNRERIIKRFAPYYNGSSSAELAKRGESDIRVLISTDVLSEGLNLQDAARLINYDIHWNPVRLMQRIGRVDRRMSLQVEARLAADHPEVAQERGRVRFWNFLPPDELNAILSLYENVTRKTLLISRTLGIEGKKLLTPEDDFEALKDFNAAYEGTKTSVEEMHLEYQALLAADPVLDSRLAALPRAIFSGRQRVPEGARGVFFCYSLPALDKELGEFTHDAGSTRWYLYDLDRDTIADEPADIVSNIRSTPATPREATTRETTLVELRRRIERHITNSYLKRVDAPVGVKPILKCWMELNEG